MKSSWERMTRSLACALALAVPSMAMAQISFYGPPMPSDFSQGVGGNETGEAQATEEEASAAEGIPAWFAGRPFRISVAIREGFDSNVNTNPNDPERSFYTNVALGLSYGFGTSRLSLSSNVGAGLTYYYHDVGGDNTQFNGALNLAATYLATPRLTLSIASSTNFLSQPDFSLVGGTNRVNGNYLATSTSITANYQWTRLVSSTTSYNFGAYYYLDRTYNDNLGNVSQTFSQSLNYLWKPKTTLVMEYRFNPILYFDVDMNQYGNYFLLGFNHLFNPRFFWNVRFGAQLNFNNNPVDGQSTYIGPFLESVLSYQAGRRTSLAWNIRYGTEQSGIFDVSQRQTFRTGLSLSYDITPRISSTFGLNYQCNYYDQANVIPSFYENLVDFSFGLSFVVNRVVSLQAGYQFTIDMAPEYTGREYTRNVVFAGVNFSL